MKQRDVQAFSVLVRFWLNPEGNCWQGELRVITDNRTNRFNGLPELIGLLNELAEQSEGCPDSNYPVDPIKKESDQ